MKCFQARKRLLVLVALVVASTSGCGVVNGIRAKSALNDGARAYKAGDFVEAQKHFEHAIALNPDQPNAPIFRARAIERQYKPTGVNTPENTQIAQDALNAYRGILEKGPGKEEAYAAVARLLGYTKQTDEQRKFVTERANNESTPSDKRADAFTFLASKQWKCSYDITEQQTSKQTIQREGKMVIEYKKPANETDFQQAQACATEGLGYAERAVSLNSNSETAYSFKANLLLEKAKIAQMENNAEAKANFERLADEARQRNAQLTEERQKKKDEEERQKKEAAGETGAATS